MSNVDLANKIVSELEELLNNAQFVQKNCQAFEEKNRDTKLADDFEMDMYKLLAEVQKAKKIVDSQVNVTFLYTPREKLQL